MSEKRDSRALQLLQLTWDGINGSTGWSWERVNHAMADALQNAIGYGFTFDAGDFAEIYRRFNAGRWLGEGGWEGSYSRAVAADNRSAIEGLEAHLGRHPFIADDVELRGGGFKHRDGRRQRGRLATGAEFTWRGERVAVTSFDDASGVLTACSYAETEPPKFCPTCKLCRASAVRKIRHRFTISPADIKADRAERKKAKTEANPKGLP